MIAEEKEWTSSISIKPPSDPAIRRAGRLLAMVHELHKAGYQHFRIAAGMSPSGGYWRCHITTTDNIRSNGWEPINWQEGVVTYSSADKDRFFGWSDAPGKNARQLAQMFIERFPDIARKGKGHDHLYAGWYVEMLGAAEKGNMPVFFADYNLTPNDSKMPPPQPAMEMRKSLNQCSGELLYKVIIGINEREELTIEGNDWWLEVGPVNMNGTLVTIQKKEKLIAAIARRDDGRLRVSVFEPLDDKSVKSLIALSQKPHPEYDVAMRENNWEYALDNSAGIGQAYAAERGESYLSYWEKGIGVCFDGTESETYRPYKDRVARKPRLVAAELVAYLLSEESIES